MRSSRFRTLTAATAAGLLAFGLGGCASVGTPPASTPRAATATTATATPSTPMAAGAAAPAASVPFAAQPPGGAATAAAAPAGFAGAARPDPSAPKPFAEVARDATLDDGFFPVWRKDDKVWLEVPVARLGEPFLLSVNIASSVGERGLVASQMGPSWMVEWRRIGNVVQLVARNTDYRASGDSALARAVAEGFSDSLLAAGPVASAEHPQRRSFLVDASLLLADLPRYSTALEAAYRLPYGIDRGNSSFTAARATARLTTLSARLHFATPRIPAPPPSAPPTPLPTPPTTVPDPRSLLVGFVYNLLALPADPMRPRAADPRLGHFAESFTDYGVTSRVNPRVHHIVRWRLDKKEPQAALSEPLQPIVFWLDRNIPQRWRGAVTEGVLEWNKAFERIGIRNALVVRQQPDDADFDTMDAQHASIRWYVGVDSGTARGPVHVDPRSGEVLDADISIGDAFARGARRFASEDLPPMPLPGPLPVPPVVAQPWRAGLGAADYCSYAEGAAFEAEFAFDLLQARDDLEPDSPQAIAFARAVIKDTITHEVGHTLGLKHNFRASTTVSRAQLDDPQASEARGISGSVMDYNPFNIALRGEPQGALNNATIGPYDYWAIEYAYKQLALADEAAELGRIAARSTEPALAYADDVDAGRGASDGIDPSVNRFDLGDDPLAYWRKRLALSRELWDRVQARGARHGDDPLRERRVLLSGFRQLRDMPGLVAKYVGGMTVLRDLPGGRRNYQPVAPARQRQALDLLATGVFGDAAFRFRPEFLASAAPDFNEWERAGPLSIPAVVIGLQTQALDRLLSAGTAQRVLDLPAYLSPAERGGAITLDEVYGKLQAAVWSELASGRDIDLLRRNLQREHLKRLQAALTRGAPGLPADAAALLRMHATRLQAQLRSAVARGSGSAQARAHLQESLSMLSEALRATMTRSG